jgi:hypothetical protein
LLKPDFSASLAPGSEGNTAVKSNTKLGVVVLLAVSLGGIFLWHRWEHDEPRRSAIASLQRLDNALKLQDARSLLDAVEIPASIKHRTEAEQAQFLSKVLQDELSAEGVEVLKREGYFGPLSQVFPDEAATWAAQAGVKPEDCVAFKLERNGVRAEVVLVIKSGVQSSESTVRIVRCNNVKQLALNPSAMAVQDR